MCITFRQCVDMAKFVLSLFCLTLTIATVKLISEDEAIAFLQAYCGKNGMANATQIQEAIVCALKLTAQKYPEVNITGICRCLGEPSEEASNAAKICSEGGISSNQEFLDCARTTDQGLKDLENTTEEVINAIKSECINY